MVTFSLKGKWEISVFLGAIYLADKEVKEKDSGCSYKEMIGNLAIIAIHSFYKNKGINLPRQINYYFLS